MNDIHIRYEDSGADPTHPFAMGIMLENISVQSTDENWVRGPGGCNYGYTCKLIHIYFSKKHMRTHIMHVYTWNSSHNTLVVLSAEGV